jgi:hypothetical protein
MVFKQNFPSLGFLEVLHHLGLISHIPPCILMLTMTLIVNHFMGKVHHYNSPGVTGIINKSIQGVNSLDVTKAMTKGMIQGVDAQQEAWGVMFVELQMNMTFWNPHSYISLTWAFFVLNDPATHFQIQLVQNMRCILCHPMWLKFLVRTIT